MIKQVLVMIIFCSLNIHAAIILKGNEAATADETFSFAIQQYRMSNAPELIGTYVYVAADPTAGGLDNVKDFAVSRVARDSEQFFGLTPKTVSLNGAQDVANPLYDQGIAFLSLFNGIESILAGAPERPIVVAQNDRKTIYFINSFQEGKTAELLSAQRNGVLTQNVPDATGAVTAGIIGTEAAAPFAFATVTPAVGNFGDSGSGVALVMVSSVENSAGKFTAPFIIDAPTGNVIEPSGNRAVPLDISSSFLKIGNNLASIGTIVDMHWHRHIGRLYIALHINGGAAGTDGGRAIAVGRITENNALVLTEIVPATVFDGSLNKIVGAIGADVTVSIHKVRSMFTSTALPYLIVQGNVGTPDATRRTVFALPLVSGASDLQTNGMIANKNANPENLFTDTSIPLFTIRAIKHKAETPEQMPLASDAATQVGGGSLPDGDITDLFVYGDTVFATVKMSDANEQPGVFYSQAIFASNGTVATWTRWRRATGFVGAVQSVLLDPITGKFSSLVANNSDQVTIVQRTEWKDGDATGLKPVVDAIQQFFLPTQAGIQGLFDFIVTSTTQNTATPGLLDISALVATGLGKVMLVQTSEVIAGGVIPIGGTAFGNVTAFQNGEITQTLPVGSSKIITIQGGVLDDIGPINAAEIARDGDAGANGYLFVGGVHGVAVLSNPDGSGWSTATGLSTGFTGLVDGMSFKKVGSYNNVRKIINDHQYLYILTLTQLDRIDLTQGNVGLGIITPTTIATRETVPSIGQPGSFLDAVISDQLVLLATNQGLVRIGDGLNVQTADSTTVSWQKIPAPETIGPMRQLFIITPSSRAQNSAKTNNGGNLLALSAFRGKNQAQIARYQITPVTQFGVSGASVQLFDDLFVENIPSYFANFGSFRNTLATDGSLYFGTLNKDANNAHAVVSVLQAAGGVQTGSRFLNNKTVPVNLDETTLIAAMLENSATGSWLIGNDAGMRVNE